MINDKKNQFSFNLINEVYLDFLISPINLNDQQIYLNNILLTGSTGFLGTFLLYELLIQTNSNIFCLVRSLNKEDSFQKIKSSLQKFQIWDEKFNERIFPG